MAYSFCGIYPSNKLVNPSEIWEPTELIFSIGTKSGYFYVLFAGAGYEPSTIFTVIFQLNCRKNLVYL